LAPSRLGPVGGQVSDISPSHELQSLEGVVVDPDSLRLIGTVDTGSGVTWELITYESSSGTCLDAVGSRPGGHRVMLGGCGNVTVAEHNLSSSWNIGPAVLDGTRHSLAFGLAPKPSAHIRVVYEGVSRDVVAVASNGFWIVDTIGLPTGGVRVSRIEAVDAQGVVLETVEVPAVASVGLGSTEEHSHSGSTEEHSH
jgi:hypothetical protein